MRPLNVGNSEPVKWTHEKTRPSCSHVGTFQVRIRRLTTSACACLPIYLIAHMLRQIVHLILSISVLVCTLVVGRPIGQQSLETEGT